MNESFRKLALFIQNRFNDFDHAAEGVETTGVDGDFRPIFIVGPPRTGTTLLYQFLLRNYRLSYISNLMALAPRHMVKMVRLAPGIARNFTGTIHPGYHGFVPGLLGPSEAGKIVDRWFDDSNWPADLPRIRQTVAAITQATGYPFLLKSLTNSVRIDRLHHALPGARFIVTSRDVRYAAQSILMTRRQLGLTADSWWSVQPAGSAALHDKPEAYRAVWQVMATNHAINDALASTGADVYHVAYEDFCDAPFEFGRRLADRFNLRASATADTSNTTRYTPSKAIRVDEATWQAIETAVQQLTSGL